MPFVQTKFFGLSIVNFTSSMGWGDNPSTLGVTLVNDPSNGDSLIDPVQGQPAIFSFGSFQFGGIVKSLGRSDDFGGSPIYNVSLEDPRELLSGVSLILSGFNGTISVPNVLNIYGYLENIGGFGSSKASSAGIPWYKVRDGLIALTNASAPDYGGAIRLGSYQFRLNLDALPTLPDYYRITSPNMSVLDFVREVCDAANHDYFFTLTVVNNQYYINLKTINRNAEPIFGAVTSFILNTPGASAKDIGYEFRNEITSKFLIGGPVSRMYGIYDVDEDDENEDVINPQDNVLWPFWGLELETDVIDNISVGGDVIMGMGYGDYHTFTVDSRLLKSELIRNNKIGMLDSYTMDVGELRAARYSQEAWEAYLWFHNYNQFRFHTTLYDSKKNTWYYEKRIDKFNDVGDFVGFEIEYFKDADGFSDTDTRYEINFSTKNELFSTRIGDSSSYGIPNPHWGKASRLGLIGGLVLGDISHFVASMDDEDIQKLTAQSFSAMKRLDHFNGATSRQQEENIARIYNFVKKYADEYYGRKWMVRVPAVSAYRDPETREVRFSHTPEQTGFIDESEWEDAIQQNLLPFDVNRLTDTDGRFFAYVKFSKYNDFDVTSLIQDMEDPQIGKDYTYSSRGRYFKRRFFLFNDISEDDKIDSEVHNSIFIKCEIDPQIYFEDAETQFRPRVVVTMPGIVKLDNDDTNDIGILSTFLTGELNRRNQGGSNFDVESTIERIASSFGSDMFKLGKEGFAYRPRFTAVPLTSNVLVYGPWYASGANGRTEFEQDDTLVPWNYGGFSAMNNAANAKVTSAISLYNISEAGSVEFPDIPAISLGDPLTNGGPYVTEVTVSIDGNSGARTSYNLATWTPHPYRMRKFLSDYISRLSKTNQQLRRNFRQLLRQPQQGSKLAELKSKTIDSLRRRPRSTHFLVGAEVTRDDNGFTRYMVGFQPVYNATTQLYGSGYPNKALASLDSLFVPFSTNPNTSGIARFERPSESGDLNIDDYNPFRSGTTTSILTHGQQFPDSISTEQGSVDFTDVRAIGLKTPLILCGWGYDTGGKPVPNSGVIATSGDPTDEFHQDYLRRQDLWKVGPLDTRWDDDRKVWVAGSNKTKLIQILDRLPASGLTPKRKTSFVGGAPPEFHVTSGDPDPTTISGVYPIARLAGKYTPANSGYLGGFVYYAREWEIDYSDTIGERMQLYRTDNYLYVANARPNMIEPSGFWTAYELNGRMILDNQMQFWDHRILEI